MSFIFPLLLGGLLLVGVPILLHLIMKQKPKMLPFPAMRFLLQRHRTNQRKLRLRHLLLLALRVLLIAGLCLALARPEVTSDRIHLGGDQAIAAVLVIDTSPSMEYTSAGINRLEAAKRRAQELLDELPDGSRVAVLDTAEPGGEWVTTVPLARGKIAEMRIRPGNSPVTSRLAEAYRLLADLDQESEGSSNQLPKFLYIFSDRTQNSWDPSRHKDLQQLSDRLKPKVNAAYIDVGLEEPVDVALVSVKMPHQVVPVDDRVSLQVTVQATGVACDTDLSCRIDGEKAAETKPIRLGAGQSQVVSFERSGLAAGFHQAEITLATSDSLPFNNALYTTFEIRGGRKVLVLVDERADADYWQLALESTRNFSCEVKTLPEVRDASPEEWSAYKVICLLNVANPGQSLWEKLWAYVEKGGGLAIVPGGQVDSKAYNDSVAAQRLLPCRLVKVVQTPSEAGVIWKGITYKHPVMAPFREWSLNQNVDFQETPPEANRYWFVERHQGSDAYTIVSYQDKDSSPALLEQTFDAKTKVRGRVMLYTTPMDRRHLDSRLARPRPWNDYLKNSFYFVLVNKTVGYLAGDADEANFQYQSGQTVVIGLPSNQRAPTFTLQGPGLSATDSLISRTEVQNELTLSQAATPGNYILSANDSKKVAYFSVNPIPDESLLTPRRTAEEIESLLGAGAVLPVGRGSNMHDALQGRWSQPLELFPWLMILVLLVLAVENLLGNKFYRRDNADSEGTEKAPREVETSVKEETGDVA